MLTATAKRILGVVCLIVGLAGLVMPIIPGAWLIFVGIELLGLTFLLPRPVRTRWESFKMTMGEKWHAWWRTRALRKTEKPGERPGL